MISILSSSEMSEGQLCKLCKVLVLELCCSDAWHIAVLYCWRVWDGQSIGTAWSTCRSCMPQHAECKKRHQCNKTWTRTCWLWSHVCWFDVVENCVQLRLQLPQSKHVCITVSLVSCCWWTESSISACYCLDVLLIAYVFSGSIPVSLSVSK